MEAKLIWRQDHRPIRQAASCRPSIGLAGKKMLIRQLIRGEYARQMWHRFPTGEPTGYKPAPSIARLTIQSGLLPVPSRLADNSALNTEKLEPDF